MHIYQVLNLHHTHACVILNCMYIGIDHGATNTRFALFNNSGKQLAFKKIKTNSDYAQFLNDLLFNTNSILGDNKAEAIVVATPGRFDYKKNIIKTFGNLDWKDIPLASDISKHFDCSVLTDHDCNVAAFGESIAGAGVGYSTVLYLTLSTGIGAGITKENLLVDALKSTEPGFMIFPFKGRPTEWEEFASGKAFIEAYGKPASEVEDKDIWKDYASRLVLGFAALIATVQPDIIVIGGSVGAHLDKFKEYLVDQLEEIKSHMWEIPPIVLASDPENSVINGCFAMAKSIHKQ